VGISILANGIIEDRTDQSIGADFDVKGIHQFRDLFFGQRRHCEKMYL
jgi:hypothetical protein